MEKNMENRMETGGIQGVKELSLSCYIEENHINYYVCSYLYIYIP